MADSTMWQELASEALAILVHAGCDLADVFIEQNRTARIRVEDGKPDQLIDGGEFGAGLRLVRGELTAFASTTDLTPASLRAAARELAEAAGQEPAPTLMLSATPGRAAKIFQPPHDIPVSHRMALVMEAERAARTAGPHIRQVTAFLGTFEQKIGIARSDGKWCEDERTQTVIWVNGVAGQDQDLQTGYESAGGSVGWEFFQNRKASEIGLLAGRRAERLLQAQPAPSGRMCVVLAAEAGGTMIHEAVGHGLEADLVQKKLSVFADKMGQTIASPLVTVADDATLPGWRGSFGYDDEGTPSQRTILVERGVLRNFLHDRNSAGRGQTQPTGNGRRQSYAHRPIPRMTNTMILAGQTDPKEILRSVPKGLYVVRMGGGQVNTVNGDFVFEINEGYLIREGSVAEPVRGATLIGNASEVLKSIDMVGSDSGMGIGTCGKEGQGVPVADAQPTLRIPEITVGGG